MNWSEQVKIRFLNWQGRDLYHGCKIATRIGTVREVVTRVFYRLQAKGLIHVDGKEIVILNIKALAGYADSEKS